MQRIVLIDAPSALGWDTWHRIEAEYGLGLIRQSLQAAMDAGEVARLPLDPFAHLLLGALNEAAMGIARAEDRQSARTEAGTVVDRLLAGLKAAKSTRRKKGKTQSHSVR